MGGRFILENFSFELILTVHIRVMYYRVAGVFFDVLLSSSASIRRLTVFPSEQLYINTSVLFDEPSG